MHSAVRSEDGCSPSCQGPMQRNVNVRGSACRRRRSSAHLRKCPCRSSITLPLPRPGHRVRWEFRSGVLGRLLFQPEDLALDDRFALHDGLDEVEPKEQHGEHGPEEASAGDRDPDHRTDDAGDEEGREGSGCRKGAQPVVVLLAGEAPVRVSIGDMARTISRSASEARIDACPGCRGSRRNLAVSLRCRCYQGVGARRALMVKGCCRGSEMPSPY